MDILQTPETLTDEEMQVLTDVAGQQTTADTVSADVMPELAQTDEVQPMDKQADVFQKEPKSDEVRTQQPQAQQTAEQQTMEQQTDAGDADCADRGSGEVGAAGKNDGRPEAVPMWQRHRLPCRCRIPPGYRRWRMRRM